MVLVFSISNFFINKNSQGGKSVCEKSIFFYKFSFSTLLFERIAKEKLISFWRFPVYGKLLIEGRRYAYVMAKVSWGLELELWG